MVSSSKRGARRTLFPGRTTSAMSPWNSPARTHTILYSMLAAFIGGQILLTGVFLMRSSPPCDCRCQWQPEETNIHGKAARSIAGLSSETEHGQMHLLLEDKHAEVINWANNATEPNPGEIDIRTIAGDDPNKELPKKRVESIKKKRKSPDRVVKNVFKEAISIKTSESFTILTTTNFAFSDLTENWLESLRRLDLTYNITIIAEDPGAWQYFSDRKVRLESSGLQINLRLTDQNESHSNALGFYTKEYIQLVGKRPHYISEILRSGVDVLFADADAVWLKDPVPLIVEEYSRYDVWVALGEGGKIPCPCFMYIKPTPRAMGMVNMWQNRIQEQLNKTSPENDQSALDSVLQNHIRYKRLRVKKLDLTAFPTGQSMFLKKGWYAAHKKDIYVVHANKIGGYAKKKFVLRWKKLWYLGKDKTGNNTKLR